MRKILPVLLACAALAAGCGGDDDDSGDGGGGKPATSGGGDIVTVHMKDIQFDPKDVTVKAGQTVRWVNDDAVEHDAVATSGADFKSDLFGKGKSYETKLDEAGKVDYVCLVHPNMTGTVTVR